MPRNKKVLVTLEDIDASIVEQEKKLEQDKADLARLKEDRRQEQARQESLRALAIGKLAMKAGLGTEDDARLEKFFAAFSEFTQ